MSQLITFFWTQNRTLSYGKIGVHPHTPLPLTTSTSLAPADFRAIISPNGVPNEPPLGIDSTSQGTLTHNHGYEVLVEEQSPYGYDLLTHAAPPAHQPQFGDPRVSHPDTDWDLNPASC
jgi:hypothetical protein